MGSSMVRILRCGSLRMRQRGSQRRGLAAAGRAGHQHQAVRGAEVLAHDLLVLLRETELAQLEHALDVLQQADGDGFAVDGRHGGDAQVERAQFDLDAGAAVLRQPPLGDVEAGQYLHARDDGARHVRWGGARLRQHAVDAQADVQAGRGTARYGCRWRGN